MSGMSLTARATTRRIALMAATVMVLSHVLPLAAQAQMVGPVPPPAKPETENKAASVLSKLLGKKKDETTENAEANPAETKPAESKPAEEKPPEATHKRPAMLSQPEPSELKVEQPQVDEANPPSLEHPRLDDPTNALGLARASDRLKNLMAMVEAKRHQEAKAELVQLRQYLIDATEAHISLYKILNEIPSARAQAQLERQLALEFGKLRDMSMLEMGKVYIAEREYPKAVKELIEVIKSQPRSNLGLKSYELLQEIGFTQKLQLAQ